MTDELLSGRYALEARLGRGGMGDVWRAHDRQLDAKVAVKLLELDATGESREKQIERFQEEAKAAAQIRSPHVVQVLGKGGSRSCAAISKRPIDSPTNKSVKRRPRPNAARAVELLEPATRSCLVLDDPVEHTRAHLWLGQALEKTGDTPD